MKIKLKKETEVTRYVLECIFDTAIYGGSNHWYHFTREACEAIKKAVPSDGKKSFSERLFEAVYDHGVVVYVHDIEDRYGDPIGELDRKTFEERLQFCSDIHGWALENELEEQGDAESSDVVFQCLALGDLIYG